MAPRSQKTTLRLRLTKGADTQMYGCQSILYACVGALALMGVAVGIANSLHLRADPSIFWWGALVLFAVFTVLRLRSTVFSYVEVGEDGLIVARRFIPYREILEVSARDNAVGGTDAVLTLRGSEEAAFRIDAIEGDDRKELFREIRREIKKYRRAERDEAALAVLDRRGRSVKAWREALGTLLGRAEGYREAAIAVADVRETLENVSASPERRLGAAITLASAGEPDAPRRIRRAASGCADARLRIALESIAAGETDDGALEEALEASRDEAKETRAERG